MLTQTDFSTSAIKNNFVFYLRNARIFFFFFISEMPCEDVNCQLEYHPYVFLSDTPLPLQPDPTHALSIHTRPLTHSYATYYIRSPYIAILDVAE